jgi:hypothetical protein
MILHAVGQLNEKSYVFSALAHCRVTLNSVTNVRYSTDFVIVIRYSNKKSFIFDTRIVIILFLDSLSKTSVSLRDKANPWMRGDEAITRPPQID